MPKKQGTRDQGRAHRRHSDCTQAAHRQALNHTEIHSLLNLITYTSSCSRGACIMSLLSVT